MIWSSGAEVLDRSRFQTVDSFSLHVALLLGSASAGQVTCTCSRSAAPSSAHDCTLPTQQHAKGVSSSPGGEQATALTRELVTGSYSTMPSVLNPQHQRNGSHSFRISIASDASSRDSSTSPSSLPTLPRLLRKRRPSDGHLASGWNLREGLVSWCGGSVGRGGPKRWWVLCLVGGIILLFQCLGYVSRGRESMVGVVGRKGVKAVDPYAVPVVDRAALEKLRLLEIHFGADEEDEDATRTARYPPGVQGDGKDDLDTAPAVAHIPDVVKPLRNPVTKMPADLLDASICPLRDGQPCAFLVPAWLGEQETKAQLHLYQLGLLALALNRTLVLPNVAKSRMGTCYASPFSFYYDQQSLADLGIPTISQADFIEWSERRVPPATAQVVSMIGSKVAYAKGAIEIDSASDPSLVPNKAGRGLCLKAPRTRLDFSQHSPLAIYPPEGYHRTETSRTGFGESVINTLRSEEVGSKSSRESSSLSAPYSLPNVLAFNYELRHTMLSPSIVAKFAPTSPVPLAFSHFAYAPAWTTIASSIATNLSPFIAIHWRTETLSPSNLSPCASALIRRVLLLQQKYPEITTVYLATDYPIEDLESTTGGKSIAHSGTFAKFVTEQHHTAMRAFLRNFEKRAKGLRLTSFAKELERMELPDELKGGLDELDPGIIGIVDKAVAMRAEIFLAGLATGDKDAGRCAKDSSFTQQIVIARESVLRGQVTDVDAGRDFKAGELFNSVTRWSSKGNDE